MFNKLFFSSRPGIRPRRQSRYSFRYFVFSNFICNILYSIIVLFCIQVLPPLPSPVLKLTLYDVVYAQRNDWYRGPTDLVQHFAYRGSLHRRMTAALIYMVVQYRSPNPVGRRVFFTCSNYYACLRGVSRGGGRVSKHLVGSPWKKRPPPSPIPLVNTCTVKRPYFDTLFSENSVFL